MNCMVHTAAELLIGAIQYYEFDSMWHNDESGRSWYEHFQSFSICSSCLPFSGMHLIPSKFHTDANFNETKGASSLKVVRARCNLFQNLHNNATQVLQECILEVECCIALISLRARKALRVNSFKISVLCIRGTEKET
jgi:hypothetical protein